MTRGDDFVPQLISRRQRRNSAIEGKERLERLMQPYKKPCTTPRKSPRKLVNNLQNSTGKSPVSSPSSTNSSLDNACSTSKTDILSKLNDFLLGRRSSIFKANNENTNNNSSQINDENVCPENLKPTSSNTPIKSGSDCLEKISEEVEIDEDISNIWKGDKRCFNCWCVCKKGFYRPKYQLCETSYTLLWEQAKREKDLTRSIQQIFERLYDEIVKNVYKLNAEVALKMPKEPEVSMYRNCYWCGKVGPRTTQFCKKCYREIIVNNKS